MSLNMNEQTLQDEMKDYTSPFHESMLLCIKSLIEIKSIIENHGQLGLAKKNISRKELTSLCKWIISCYMHSHKLEELCIYGYAVFCEEDGRISGMSKIIETEIAYLKPYFENKQIYFIEE